MIYATLLKWSGNALWLSSKQEKIQRAMNFQRFVQSYRDLRNNSKHWLNLDQLIPSAYRTRLIRSSDECQSFMIKLWRKSFLFYIFLTRVGYTYMLIADGRSCSDDSCEVHLKALADIISRRRRSNLLPDGLVPVSSLADNKSPPCRLSIDWNRCCAGESRSYADQVA